MESSKVQDQLSQSAQQVLSDYDVLEPDEGDTWNPVKSEFEVAYRLSLLYCTARAMSMSRISLEAIKLLDLGCGNGRSTRMYVDLGLRPEQLIGLDLRPGTISFAQKLNPAIRFMSYDGKTLPFANQDFNWIAMAGVISQIQDLSIRQFLIEEAYQKLQPGGFVYIFDKYRASGLVGGGEVRLRQYFSSDRFRMLWYSPIRSYQFIPVGEKLKNLTGRELSQGDGDFKKKLLTRLSQFVRPSHAVLLVQKA